jgi:hypothetical protein
MNTYEARASTNETLFGCDDEPLIPLCTRFVKPFFTILAERAKNTPKNAEDP